MADNLSNKNLTNKTTDRYLTFNQMKDLFIFATNDGFTVYNLDPLKERFKRKLKGTIGIIEPYLKTNLFAIVGGGENPWIPPTRVVIWDDYLNKIVATIDHSKIIKNVKLYKSFIYVVLDNSIFVYNFNDLKNKFIIQTANNQYGLIAVNDDIVVYPGQEKGTVNVYKIINKEEDPTPVFENLKTHDNHLNNIAISPNSQKIATVSEKGTIIRIHSLKNGNLIKELRRGVDQAEIYDIRFDENVNPKHDLLSVLSDKNTLHIYSISEKGGASNSKSTFAAFSSILPSYFNSEWSLIQIQTRPYKSICYFNSPYITIISSDGYVTKYEINPDNQSHKEIEVIPLQQ